MKDAVFIGLFALLTAVGASVKIPFLPYHPNTPQLLPILLSGAFLGSARGLLSQMLFLALGLLGVPLFNNLAPAWPVPTLNASPLFIATGLKAGWLLGFLAASYVAGRTIEFAGSPSAFNLLTAIIGGLLVLYACGIAFPVLVLKAPVTSGFINWLWPFFAADVLKALLAFAFLLSVKRTITRLPLFDDREAKPVVR